MFILYIISIILFINIISTYSFQFKTTSPLIYNMKNRKYHQIEKTKLNVIDGKENDIIQGIGIEGCKLKSPSGINSLSIPIQFGTVCLISIALYFGTILLINFINVLEIYLPDIMKSWENTWFILGGFFTLAGIAHFTVKKDFENIYPNQGSWGIWYLPGSPQFHVAWTGVAEIVLGLTLLIGGLNNLGIITLPTDYNIMQMGGRGLLYLTISVTPANIYMLTHGARLPVSGPEVPINFHIIRLLIQCLLFAMFYKISVM